MNVPILRHSSKWSHAWEYTGYRVQVRQQLISPIFTPLWPNPTFS